MVTSTSSTKYQKQSSFVYKKRRVIIKRHSKGKLNQQIHEVKVQDSITNYQKHNNYSKITYSIKCLLDIYNSKGRLIKFLKVKSKIRICINTWWIQRIILEVRVKKELLGSIRCEVHLVRPVSQGLPNMQSVSLRRPMMVAIWA